jgi:TRAP-type C4-dicarboxylate transport system permease small subunit
LIVFASAQIVLRNVFSIGVTWGDGLIRLAVLWLALLGALAASRDDRHITVGALVRWLPPRAQHVAHVVASLFGAAVSGFFAWYSLLFVRDSQAFGDTLLNELPAWPLQAIMPIAFGLIAYRYLLQALRR